MNLYWLFLVLSAPVILLAPLRVDAVGEKQSNDSLLPLEVLAPISIRAG